MTNREKLINDILTNGKRNTWKEYAQIYNLRDEKQANDYWRYYERTGNIVPRLEEDTIGQLTINLATAPEGFKVNKIWGKPDSYQYSYSKESTTEDSLKDFKNALVEDIKAYSPTVHKFDNHEETGIYYEISLPDLHFGKGELKDTVYNFQKAVHELVQRVKHMKVKRFILPIGNDILNSEGLRRSTTKGTPQFDSADWRETFRVAWIAVVEVVIALTKTAPVDVIIIQGNHDYERSFYMGDVISAYFSNNENVTVDNSFDTRKYYSFGKNIIMFDHGEIKPDQYPLIMATEVPMQWAHCTNREVHLGHLHHEIVKEYRGVKVRFLPALCGNDEWHKRKGYDAMRAGQGYKWSEENGLLGYEEVRPWI